MGQFMNCPQIIDKVAIRVFLPLETPRVNIVFFGQELQLFEPAEGR